MAMEIEAKYLLDPNGAAKILDHPLIRQWAKEPIKQQHLVSTYYDTSDLALKKSRIALRIRKTDSGWVQTIKGDATSIDGLSARVELEWDLAENRLDYNLITNSEFANRFTSIGGVTQLKAAFITDFKRAILDLQLADGTQIELALDRGSIIAGRHNELICELELELKTGSTEAMTAFCVDLKTKLDLQPGNESKAKRGYRLLASEAR